MRGRFVRGYGILYGKIDVVTNNVHQSTLVVGMLINEWVNNEYPWGNSGNEWNKSMVIRANGRKAEYVIKWLCEDWAWYT